MGTKEKNNIIQMELDKLEEEEATENTEEQPGKAEDVKIEAEAILRVADAFVQQNPDCVVMISLSSDADIKHSIVHHPENTPQTATLVGALEMFKSTILQDQLRNKNEVSNNVSEADILSALKSLSGYAGKKAH